jgi:hypothetical protein
MQYPEIRLIPQACLSNEQMLRLMELIATFNAANGELYAGSDNPLGHYSISNAKYPSLLVANSK